ncbi:hypothetical protein T484DRAFT_1982677 [Baffinella frigidus]|nr:hypothetical protein T484DRAFT_1982677 [Cryptophyta sp. CCMP2293]
MRRAIIRAWVIRARVVPTAPCCPHSRHPTRGHVLLLLQVFRPLHQKRMRRRRGGGGGWGPLPGWLSARGLSCRWADACRSPAGSGTATASTS